MPYIEKRWVFILLAIFILCCVQIGYGQDTDTPSQNEIEDGLDGFDDLLPTQNQDQGQNQDQNQSDPELDDLLDGFSDQSTTKETEASVSKKNSVWDRITHNSIYTLSGYVKVSTAFNVAHDHPENNPYQPIGSDNRLTDFRGLSRLRPEVMLTFDVNLPNTWKARVSGKAFYDLSYEINDRKTYPDRVLNEYETEAEFREVYIQGSLAKRLDLKVGRQIVVWGKSDSIRITDVLNPLDNREPGMVDIEDLRLPVCMTRLDYYIGSWDISAIAIHETRVDKNPVYGNDFYPLAYTLPEADIPSSSFENTQWAGAVNGIFSGFDISVYSAYYFSHQPYVQISPAAGNVDFNQLQAMLPYLPPATSVESLIDQYADLKHSRLTMVGAAFNIALGNWLVKSEAAWINGFEFATFSDDKKSRFDILGGIEYSGLNDTTIAIEAANRHMIGFDDRMKQAPDFAQQDEVLTAIRYTGDFKHDTLHLVILAMIFNGLGQDGSMQRITLEYDVNDHVSALLGAAIYQSGDSVRYQNIGDNDRAFFDIKVGF